MLNHWYEIPTGYEIVEREVKVHVTDLCSCLQGKKQDRYTFARHEGDTATLTQHTIRCPHCRKSHPAYPRYLNACFGVYIPPQKRVSAEAIAAWASPQDSFFSEEANMLVFNPLCNGARGPYHCPFCKKESRPQRWVYQVMAEFRRGKAVLTCRGNDSADLLRMNWNCRRKTNLVFPLMESVTFNFRTGKVYLRLCSGDGSVITVRNIAQPEDWENSTVYRLLKENTLVRRITVQAFRAAWRGALPFTLSALTPDLLIPLCGYIGYPQDFYMKIPYGAGKYHPDRSFASTAGKLRTCKGLQDLLNRSGLPRSKAVRRAFFRSPVYAFYLPEWEILYDCVGNGDIFLRLFHRPFTCAVLNFLHQYPGNTPSDTGVACFFRDYALRRGPAALLRKLESCMSQLQVYAVHYACMNAAFREREQARWENGTVSCRPPVPFSVPMPISSIPDAWIDGYEFVLLKTKMQYQEAGKALHNCLVEWKPSNRPVFAVKKGGAYEAAIEIGNDTTVIQLLGDYNVPVSPNSKLHRAFETWKYTYGLNEDQGEFAEDDYGHTDILSQLDCAGF